MPRDTLHLINTIIDCARTRDARPWSELVHRPHLPIRENYLQRLLVNLVWNARNYVIIVLFLTLVASVQYPLFLLCFPPAFVAQKATNDATNRLSVALQLVALAVNFYVYGAVPGLVTTAVCVAVTMGHAVFTPYTDEGLKLTDALLMARGDEELPPPKTPVMPFVPALPPSRPSSHQLDLMAASEASHHNNNSKSSAAAGNFKTVTVSTVTPPTPSRAPNGPRMPRFALPPAVVPEGTRQGAAASAAPPTAIAADFVDEVDIDSDGDRATALVTASKSSFDVVVKQKTSFRGKKGR